MKMRWLFAESGNFLLYDCFEASGSVDENVFAYSNRSGDARALVVYNNRYGTAHGTIDHSAAYADKGLAQLRQRRLSEGLGLTGDPRGGAGMARFADGAGVSAAGEPPGRAGPDARFACLPSATVFLDWRELYSTAEKPWDRLCDWLDGRGVPSLEDALVNWNCGRRTRLWGRC